MFKTTDSARRSSAALGGLMLAALLSGADLATPTAAAAQAISADNALLGRFQAGFAAIGSGSAGDGATGTDARFPSPERALLGKVEAGRAEGRVREGETAGAFIKPVGGEQALLGRRGRAIS